MKTTPMSLCIGAQVTVHTCILVCIGEQVRSVDAFFIQPFSRYKWTAQQAPPCRLQRDHRCKHTMAGHPHVLHSLPGGCVLATAMHITLVGLMSSSAFNCFSD